MKVEDYLKKLISFKTLSHDHEENLKAFAWVKKELYDLPLFFQNYSNGGYPSLLITTQSTKKPKIWLQGHMDVVPGPDKIFQPHTNGTKLFGRGTFDMKFAIACYIQLLRDLGNKLSQYDIGVMLTSDEEIGGKHGVGSLLKEGYSSKICLLPDGGENWIFQRGAKGIYQAVINSKGKAAHGARPWKGQNAIEDIMKFLSIMKQNFHEEPCSIQDHYHNTLNVGKIFGGTASNQVPVEASASIDIRYVPETSQKEIQKMLVTAQRQCNNITISKKATGLSYLVDTENKYFLLYSKIVKEKLKRKNSFLFSPGSSDGRYFINKKIPTILIRPVGANLHRDDEWIDLKELEIFYEVLKQYIMTIKDAK